MIGPVEISREAQDAFKRQLARSGDAPNAVRLGVRGGGCSGFTYVIEFDYGPKRPGDIEWYPEAWTDNVTFRIDPKSVLYLSGSRVAWKKTLMREGFEFENPHEASSCGCGHSFNAK